MGRPLHSSTTRQFTLLIITITITLHQTFSQILSSSTRLESIGAYKISPKACRVEARSGTCMFVWECLKSEGRHLGMCVDGFMFGSCCSHNTSINEVNDNNSVKITTESTTFTTQNEMTTTEFPTLISSSSNGGMMGIDESIYELLPPIPKKTTTTTQAPFLQSNLDLEESLPFVTYNSSFFQPEHQIVKTEPPEIVTIKNTTPKPTTTTTIRSTTTTRPTTTSTTTQTTTTTTTTTPQPEIIIQQSDIENEEDFCGRAPLYPQMRIVGGKQSALGQFPWIASIRRTSFFGFSSTHRCGGALLNSGWVATAGHCVDDLLTSQIRVRLGEWDFSGTDEKYPHIESTIVKKIVHPSYNFFTYENDLALLKLEKPLNFSKYVRPICLPGNQDLLIGENATVAGWGRLTENGQLPSRLQHVTVPIMSNDRCRELFLKSNRVEHIPDIFLCAGYEKGGQDSCQGDSGGPLQVKGRDGRYFLGGIISWGIGCAEPNMPGVCTRISKFTDWIMAHVT